MAISKKKTDQMVVVDARKLSQGLKATFEGVALVFDSLGVDIGSEVEEKATAAKVKAGKTAKAAAEEPAPEKEPAPEVTEDTEDAGAADDAEKNAPDDTSPAPSSEAESKEENTVAPSITLDDVTKIIVQKIKQNRGNNEKIGQILKTYGVAKVGDLDASKYEAFLTDVAAL